MRKIARIIQAGKSNPKFYIDRDILEAISRSVEGWEQAPVGIIGNTPEACAYEVWIVPVEDKRWSECEGLLPVGEYVESVVAERPESEVEGDFVYQPLLTGRRVQIHKCGRTVKVFDHKGREMSGSLSIEDETYDISRIFLSVVAMEEPESAIFDAVILSTNDRAVVTDVLRWNEVNAANMPCTERMSLAASVEWDDTSIAMAECFTSFEDVGGDALARPANEGYFSKWLIFAEENHDALQ